MASVVAGASRPDQVQENVGAIQTHNQLTVEEFNWLQQHTKADVYDSHR